MTTPTPTASVADAYQPTEEEVQAATQREQALFQQASHQYLNDRIVTLSVQLAATQAELARLREEYAGARSAG